jgi:hypothetical protein
LPTTAPASEATPPAADFTFLITRLAIDGFSAGVLERVCFSAFGAAALEATAFGPVAFDAFAVGAFATLAAAFAGLALADFVLAFFAAGFASFERADNAAAAPDVFSADFEAAGFLPDADSAFDFAGEAFFVTMTALLRNDLPSMRITAFRFPSPPLRTALTAPS